MTLVQFLHARLDENEQVARAPDSSAAAAVRFVMRQGAGAMRSSGSAPTGAGIGGELPRWSREAGTGLGGWVLRGPCSLLIQSPSPYWARVAA